MFDGWGLLVFLAFLAVFVYLLAFAKGEPRREDAAGGGNRKAGRPGSDEHRDRALAELEERARRARRRQAAMSAKLDEDPAAAARTLRRMMKRR